jgi:hypothetical protein
MHRKSNLLLVLLAVSFFSCNDNTIETASAPELLLSVEGLVEHLGGDCSAVQVRTRSLGSADLNQFSKLKIELSGTSDADLSSIQIYYFVNGEQYFLIDLPGREEINSTRNIEVNSPDFTGELYSRVTLKSSVCTGQIYYLTLRDVRIFGIR